LTKRKQNSRQNDASAHRPYAGPPFCRAVAFSSFWWVNGSIAYTKKPFPVWRKGFAELDIPY